MVCLFPHTLGSCCDDDEEKEEEERYGMPGLTPASEQSFDFDDHAYAAAPGSHGGSVDGENAFVPPRCVFFVVLFFFTTKHARAGAASLRFGGGEYAEERIESRRRGRRGGSRSRGFCARRVPKSAKCNWSLDPLLFFYICVFVERFFVCVRETSDSRRRKNPPTLTPACDLSFRRHEKQVPGV